MKLNNLPKRIEFALHICMLLVLMSAFVPLWRQMSGFSYDPVEGDSIQRGILLCGYLLTIPVILFYPRNSLQTIIRHPVPWLMILWAGISVLWSGSPDITLRRVIAILLTTLYALILCIRYRFRSFIYLLGIAFFIVILSSLLMVLLKPDWGLMSSVHEGAWEGVFVHKNTLGKVSVFSIGVFLSLFTSSRNLQQRVFWATALGLATLTLLGTRSVSALLIAGTMVIAGTALRMARVWNKVLPVILLLVLLIGSGAILLIIQNNDVLLEALDRDISLTGRIPLWQVLVPIGLEQPLGYGYGAFWLGWNGPSAEVWSALHWFVPNAHNGFLEVWLNLGWVGLGLALILLGRLFLSQLRPAVAGSEEAIFWISFCIVLITYNLVEVNLFNQNNIYWVMTVYAALASKLWMPGTRQQNAAHNSIRWADSGSKAEQSVPS